MGSLTGITYALATRTAAFLVLCAFAPASLALETDQYYAWKHPLADATSALNAKLNLELGNAVSEFARQGRAHTGQCTQISEELMHRLHFTTFQDFELWALNSPLVDRYPPDPQSELEYREKNLYHRHGLIDVSTWLPNVPTIEVNGFRLGTDKLAHFVSSGWRWYRSYLAALDQGLTREEAEKQVIDTGVFWERTMLGKMASGVLSPADLEANYQGMHFYHDLCHGDNPVLQFIKGRWQATRSVDVSRHIGPEWDESFNTPIYSKRRWRKVKPVLVGYCADLTEPVVVERRERYAAVDQTTRIEREVQRLVQAGKLPDPYQFSIDANCGDRVDVPQTRVLSRHRPNSVKTSTHTPDLMESIRVSDSNIEHRPVGVFGLNFSVPDRFGGSTGVIWAKLPRDYDCTTLCPFEGPMLQLQLGTGASRLAAGWVRVIGEQRDNTFFLSNVYVGLGFKGSVLHTWGNPYSEQPGRTFIGGEFEFSIVEINFRGGVYRRVAGPEPDDPWLWTATVGWGF
jgi:hypothetical protein